jgi:hypothetical protein
MVGFGIDVHPVAASELAATRALLRAGALPQLHEWTNRDIAADETWQQTSQQHYWRLVDGRLAPGDEV